MILTLEQATKILEALTEFIRKESFSPGCVYALCEYLLPTIFSNVRFSFDGYDKCVTVTIDPYTKEPTPYFLDVAKSLTRGDRDKDYGSPSENMQYTADIWNTILKARGRLKSSITAEEVGLCMIGVKLARQSFKPKDDNLIDVAGYVDVTDRVLRGE